MKTKIKIAFAILAIAIAYLFFGSSETVSYVAPVETAKPKLTHAQEVWVNVLEWCESRGKTTAINPKDRDGTPSYYSFQFKPSTFKYYGQKYEVIGGELSDQDVLEAMKSWDNQKEIVSNMVLDASIKWEREFPDCIKKYGRPPKY